MAHTICSGPAWIATAVSWQQRLESRSSPDSIDMSVFGQNFDDGLEEEFWSPHLANKSVGITGIRGDFIYPRNQDHRDCRPHSLHGFCEVSAIHARHHEIRENKIDVRTIKLLQCFRALGLRYDLVPLLLQYQFSEDPGRFLIVHTEDSDATGDHWTPLLPLLHQMQGCLSPAPLEPLRQAVSLENK